jgi:hypothetical protein
MQPFERRFAVLSIQDTSGLVNEIATAIFASAFRGYEDFALASAFQIIAACAQGSYLLPDGRPLCLYQMVLAPASAGKGAYIGAVKETIKAAFPRLISAEPGSREGLRFIMHEWNAKTLVIDEFQGFLDKLGDDSNPHIKGIADDFKEIWPGTSGLLGIATKTTSSPALKRPRLGVLGVGTPSGVAKAIKGGVVSDGLLSRFNIFHIARVVESVSRGRPEFNPEKYRIRLFTMAKEGMNEKAGCDVTHESWFDRWKKEQPEHEPQALSSIRMSIEPDAEELIEYHQKQWERYLISEPESAAGAVYDRGATRGLQYAALHCLGRGDTCIRLKDTQVGLNFALVSIENTLRLIDEEVSECKEEKDCKKILKQLRNKGPQKGRVLRSNSNLYEPNFSRALNELILRDEVMEVEKIFYCK